MIVPGVESRRAPVYARRMSRRFALALSFAAALIFALPAPAEANPFKDFGRAVKSGAKTVGHGVKDGAKTVGRGVKGAFKGGGASVRTGAKAGGKRHKGGGHHRGRKHHRR